MYNRYKLLFFEFFKVPLIFIDLDQVDIALIYVENKTKKLQMHIFSAKYFYTQRVLDRSVIIGAILSKIKKIS